MARKFWTLLPEAYYTHKQMSRGGRNELLFTALGCFIYYFSYTAYHRKPSAPSNEVSQVVNGSKWF